MVVSPADTIGLLLALVCMTSLAAVVIYAIRGQSAAYIKASAAAILSLAGTWLCLGI